MTEHVHPPSRARHWRLPVLVVALAVATVALVQTRFQILDPYRAGSAHHGTMTVNAPCWLVFATDDGALLPTPSNAPTGNWVSDDSLPPDWPTSERAPARITGTLRIDTARTASFTADAGGSVRLHLGFCPAVADVA